MLKKHIGKVNKVVGLTIESTGPPGKIGELCLIYDKYDDASIYAEIVGFKDEKILLMPFADITGISTGSFVESCNSRLKIPVGMSLKGRIMDGLGNFIDDKGCLDDVEDYYPVEQSPPQPLKRKRITEPLSLGIKSIDGLLTCGKGQRLGIFSGSGVGKSTLLGMIARNTKADINVIALIGERGREVKEFLESDLKQEGLSRSVVVVATSDQPALIRLKGAMLATSIAEFFRDKGMDVMLMMDSLTRFAMAQREVGLAIGEPPVTRGYTPSVFGILPKLLERSGPGEKGTITGIYTVLVDGDDMNEPITDAVRGILDGHIVLSRKLADSSHYPAIDIMQSISRIMPNICEKEQLELANKIKKILATYKDAEDLINIGAYSRGSNPDIDYALKKIALINDFLIQSVEEKVSFDKTIQMMKEIF